MDKPEYITEKEFHAMGRFALQTLRNWRHEGKGPEYVKIGRAVRYPLDAVIRFMEQARIVPNGK